MSFLFPLLISFFSKKLSGLLNIYPKLSYFTEKGLETKEAVIEDEANICKTIVIDVGNQTWFTRM